jgi:hypothetical protein
MNGQHLQGYGVMGTLDDAIREHLELKRRLGAPEDELKEKETEAFGQGGTARPPLGTPPPEPAVAEPAPAYEPEPTAREAPSPPAEEADPWVPGSTDDEILAADEVLPEDSLEPNGSYAPPEPMPAAREEREPHEDPLDEWEGEPEPPEDLLEETPEFLEETPEHDRLWFEQKPPKDFDFD